MAIKSFLSEGGFSVGSVGSTPVEVIDSSGNVTAQTISGTNLTLSGNLTVNGSTVTVNSTTTTVDDPIFTIGGDTAPSSDDNKDRGIEFRWHNGTSAKVGFFGYDDSAGKFVFVPDATNTSEVFSGTVGAIDLSGSLSAGSGINFNSSTGQISNTGVLSIAGTANQVFVNGITNAVNGNVTLSLPQNIDTGANTSFGSVTATTFYLKNNNQNYINEGYGIKLNAASTIHPVQVLNASLIVGSAENLGSDYGSGNIYASGSAVIGSAAANTVYSGVKLYLSGGSGIIVAGTASATYGSGIKFRNDGYEHFTVGVKGNGFAIAKTGANGTQVWSATPTDVFNIAYSGEISVSNSITTSSGGFIANGADPGVTVKASSNIGRIWFQKTAATAQTWQLGTSGNDGTSVAFNIDDYTSGSTKLKVGIGANGAFTFNAGTGGYAFNGSGTAAFAGSVGVGTTSPTSLLHIYGGYPHVTLQNPTSGSGVTMLFVDGTTVKHTIGHINSSSKLQFGTGGTGTGSTWNGSIAMTIDGSQNIGIGTTSPTYKLHVVGDARLGANGQRIWLYDDGNAHIHSTSAPLWINSDDSSGVYINNQNSGNVILTNTTAGSVGIGTTSPAVKFHVADNAAGIQQRISSSHANGTSLQFVSTSTNGRSMRIGHNFVSGAGEFAIYDDTAAATRVYINTSGNIGLGGNTNPQYKLDVNGSVNTADWYYVQTSGKGMFNSANSVWFASHRTDGISLSSNTTAAGLLLYSGGSVNTFRGWFYGDSDGQGFVNGSQNWQLIVDSSSRLRVYSGIYNLDAGIRILNPGGAAYSTQTSTVTGAFKIRLPVDRYKSNTMMRMTVKIVRYSTGLSHEFEIGGYNYSDAAANWYNVFAEQKSDGGTSAYTVRFGNDGTANCIWIGETTSTWDYPQVFVTEFQGGYSGTTAGWASGWSISAVTTFDTVTQSRTASQVVTANNIGTLINNAGNLTIGGTINIVGDANSGTPDLYFNNAGGFGSASGQVRAYAPNNSSLAYYWDASYVTYYNSIRVVDGSSNVKVYLDSSTGSSYFNGGNLGVGTTTPLKKLTVYNGTAVIHGETAGAASINESTYGLVIAPLIQRSSTVGNYYPGIAFNHLYQYSGQGTTTYNANAHGWIGLRLTDTTGTERSSLVFATKTGTGNPGLDLPAERMCIRHDGNVGIGATDPGHKLEVSGNVLATKVFVGTANASYDLYNNGTSYLNGAVTTGGALTVGTNLTVGSGGGVTGLTLTQNWRLRRENATTGDFILDESGVDKLRITSAGNATLAGSVTVGTSSKINWSSSAQFESPSNGVVTISSNNGSYPGYLNVGGIQSWDGVIALSIGTGTGHVTANADLTVTGNLIVNGTTTTVNSTTATVKDPIITLGGGNAGTAASSDDNKDRGIEFKWHNGTAAKTGFFGFDDSTGYLIFIPDATNTSEVFSGTLGDIQATNFRGNLIGNVTGNVSGTAGGETLATVTGRGATTSTAVTLSSTGNHYAGHHYFDAFDTAGNHYPHYQAGSDGTGAIANIRVGQSGGTHKLFILNGKDGAISWNGNTVWHAGNDGSGSGLDADLLDGYNQDTANTASTIVRRDASGNFSAGTITAALTGAASSNLLLTGGTLSGKVTWATNMPNQKRILGIYETGNLFTGIGMSATTASPMIIGDPTVNVLTDFGYLSNDGNYTWNSVFTVEKNIIKKTNAGAVQFIMNSTDSSSKEIVFQNNGSTVGYIWHSGSYVGLGGGSGNNSLFVNSGNVGIGTTSPAHKLHILSSAGQDGINIDAVTYPEIVLYRNSVVKAYIGIAGNAGGYTVSPGSLADSLVVRSENAIHLAPAAGGYVSLTAATNGNIGIGITSPSSKLHVQEVGTDGTPAIRITTTSAPSTFSWATSAINSSLTAGKNYIHLIGQAESSKNSGYIGFNFQSSGSNSNLLTFGHYSADNLFNISAGGSVGIGTGTSAPGYKLEVSGAIGTYGLVRLGSTDYTTSVVLSVAPGVVNFDAPGVSGGRFKIDSSGNVGINNASPNYKLDVNGTGVFRDTLNFGPSRGIISWGSMGGGTGFGIQAASGNALSLGAGATWDYVIISASGNVGIGVNPTYKLEVNGSFAATTKSFVIPHPTKPGKKLRYGSLEGPENGVYVRGRLKGSNTIELPDYWEKLVDPDSITVNLTPIGKHQKLYVDSVSYKRVIVEKEGLFSGEIDCYYTIFAERIDVEKLQVEIDAK